MRTLEEGAVKALASSDRDSSSDSSGNTLVVIAIFKGYYQHTSRLNWLDISHLRLCVHRSSMTEVSALF